MWKEYINSPNYDKKVAQKHIVCKLNHPETPQFGGLLERLGKSCRKARVAILNNGSLTEEVCVDYYVLSETDIE